MVVAVTQDTGKKVTCSSDVIDIRKLERESRTFLYLGFVVAVLVHAVVGFIIPYRRVTREERAEMTVRKPIPVDLVVVPPRMREPYEMTPRRISPRPFKRIKPWFILPDGTFLLRVPEGFEVPPDRYTFDTDSLIQAIVEADVFREIKDLVAPEPFRIPRIYQDMTITRELEREFSFREEMISLDDIDELGIYKGFVVQDLTDKQNIKGFVHIPQFILGVPSGYNPQDAFSGLAEAFNHYTGIEMKIDDPIPLGSPDLMEYPLIYITTNSNKTFSLNVIHTKNFGGYLRNGGFAIIDNGSPWGDCTLAEASLLNLLLEALGNDIRFEPIEHDHPIYHCFFDFNGLQPEGAESRSSPGGERQRNDDRKELPPNPWDTMPYNSELNTMLEKVSNTSDSLFGVWLGERLVAVYSNDGYGVFLGRGVSESKNSDVVSRNNDTYNFNPQLKLGINMMVYALTQKGGIAKRYIDYDASRRTYQEEKQ